MTYDAGQDMKARIRVDLRAAMKAGHSDEARLFRTLIAAIDNAEAPSIQAERPPEHLHRFHDGSAEIERLSLSSMQVRAILAAEIQEREQAAAEMNRLERPDRAEALLAEALLASRYIE